MNTLNLKVVEGDLNSGQFFLTSKFDNLSIEQFIDTGSTFTSVPWQSFSNYPITGSSSSKGLANNPHQQDKISIQKFYVGDYVLDSFTVIRLKEESKMMPTLGVDAFQKTCFVFDSINKTLSFTNIAFSTKKSPLDISSRGLIYLKADIEAKFYNAIWDTGAGLTTIDESILDASPDNFEFIEETEGDDCNESSLRLKLYKAKLIKVGYLEFKDLDVLVHDFQPISQVLGEQVDLALGFNAIIQKKWFFDLNEKKWTAE